MEVLMDRSLAFAAIMQGIGVREAANSAQRIVEGAQTYAPVETGALRDGIYAVGQGGAEWDVISSAPYSAYQEFGTSRNPPHPFMTPAIEEEHDRFFGAIKAAAAAMG